jgi:hypothetical protein
MIDEMPRDIALARGTMSTSSWKRSRAVNDPDTPWNLGGLTEYGALPNTLGALAGFAQKPVLAGLYFNHQTFGIDGYKFTKCRFDACRLIVESSNFEFDHCIIDEATLIEYRGDIVRVVKLFNSRYSWAPAMFPAFAPIRHEEDNTFSIG